MTRDVRVKAYVWTTILACIAVILLASRCSAECQPSARAVWNDHPGSHATWNTVEGQRCWRVGYGKHHRKEVMRIVSGSMRRSRHSGQTPTIATRPLSATAAVHWKHPWHADLYRQFQMWRTFSVINGSAK